MKLKTIIAGIVIAMLYTTNTFAFVQTISLPEREVNTVRLYEEIAYPVQGGNIYFDGKGKITKADPTVTRADIPQQINSVAVTEIGDEAFADNTVLKYINLPNGLTHIGMYAFYGCTALESADIPATVKKIDFAAFYGCSGLLSVYFEEGLEEISSSAFSKCNMLRGVYLPKSLSKYSSDMFFDCPSLKTITVVEGGEYLKSVDGILFSADGTKLIECPGAYQSEDFWIPSTVTEISSGAFSACSKISHFSVQEGNTVYMAVEGVIFTRTGKRLVVYPCGAENESYTVPYGVEHIRNTAFCECDNLKTIKIPNGVKTIGASAFNGCDGLTEISLPPSVEGIGQLAFAFCPNTTQIRLHSNISSIAEAAFAESEAAVLIVKEGSFAKEYAVGNDLKYEIALPLKGDVDWDGIVNRADYIAVSKYFSGSPSAIDEENTEVSGDGTISRVDYITFSKYFSGKTDVF